MKRIMCAVTAILLSLIAGNAFAQSSAKAELKPGLFFELLRLPRGDKAEVIASDEEIAYMLSSTRTNGFYVAQLPLESRFIFIMRDSTGKIVPKTELGRRRSLDVDPTKGPRKLKIQGAYVTPSMAYCKTLFKADDYFVLNEKGTYTLEVRIRVWTQKTNGGHGVVVSGPVHASILKR